MKYFILIFTYVIITSGSITMNIESYSHISTNGSGIDKLKSKKSDSLENSLTNCINLLYFTKIINNQMYSKESFLDLITDSLKDLIYNDINNQNLPRILTENYIVIKNAEFQRFICFAKKFGVDSIKTDDRLILSQECNGKMKDLFEIDFSKSQDILNIFKELMKDSKDLKILEEYLLFDLDQNRYKP